jgi:hypothetical protein
MHSLLQNAVHESIDPYSLLSHKPSSITSTKCIKLMGLLNGGLIVIQDKYLHLMKVDPMQHPHPESWCRKLASGVGLVLPWLLPAPTAATTFRPNFPEIPQNFLTNMDPKERG